MVKKLDLPYLVAREVRKNVKGQVKTYRYWYFERAGDRIPLKDEGGKFLSPDDEGFLTAYENARSGRSQRPVLKRFTFKNLILHYKERSRTKQGKKKRKAYLDLAPRTRKDYDKCLEYLDRNLGDRDFRRTTRPDIVAMMDANDHRKKFANDLKQVASIIFEHAIDQGWMASNPAQGVQKFHTGDGYEAWPLPVLVAFWNAADYDTRLALILYLDSGQRGGDVLDYRWSDLTESGIRVVQNKTGTEVFVPFTDWLRDALDIERKRQLEADIVALPPNDYILQGPKGGKLSYNTLNDRFVRIRKDAKIDSRYVLHGLRYTAAEELARAAGEAGASVTGHLTKEMFHKYAGRALREVQAEQAQAARNRTRKERDSLKLTLKPK